MDNARILILNEDTFDETVKSSPLPILVDFWTDWCRSCADIEPSLAALAEEFRGRVWIAKVNVDDSGDVANRFGIRNVPTLVVFRGGKVVDQVVGAAPLDHLRALVRRHILPPGAGVGPERARTE